VTSPNGWLSILDNRSACQSAQAGLQRVKRILRVLAIGPTASAMVVSSIRWPPRAADCDWRVTNAGGCSIPAAMISPSAVYEHRGCGKGRPLPA
jgi:hypothetical protein